MMIDATLTPKIRFVSPFGTIVCNVNHSNARPELLPEAAAQRTLEGVGSSAWFGRVTNTYLKARRVIKSLRDESDRGNGTGDR
jgi:hypothetical protein